ncbi:tetratricopeptide repeat protein [Mesorhizobium sp. M0859]|uniref:tetratricopeptide repeat protein n=1 Tax=Mesorhizobium sp. M0859 TaxID=2957014 RepID=UPI0033362258
MKWYRLSADQGFAPAQNDLGTMYASGRGVPKDASDAAKWFQLAADRGFVPAQYNLAVMYETGHGMPQDDVQALKWLSLVSVHKRAYFTAFTRSCAGPERRL